MSRIIVILSLVVFLTETKFLRHGFDVHIQDIVDCYKYKHANIPWTLAYFKRKYNRTTEVFDINANLTLPFDDSQYMEVKIAKWGNGGWQNNFIYIRQKYGCTLAFKIFGSFAKDIADMVGIPRKCPVPKRNYYVHNLTLNAFRDIPLFVAPGIFNITVISSTGDNKIVLGCFEVIFEIKERM